MLIIVNKPGQLGNRLIVFANFIAVSEEYKVNIINPSLDEFADYFIGSFRKNIIKYPVNKIKIPFFLNRKLTFTISNYFTRAGLRVSRLTKHCFNILEIDWDEKYNLDDERTIKFIKNKKITFVMGWQYRADELIVKHKNAILNYFKPVPHYQNSIKEYCLKIKERDTILIGVHIRRGDYKQFENGKYFFENEIYLNHMIKIRELFDMKIKFVICSNEKIDFNYFAQKNLDFVKGLEHELLDMYLFSMCDFLIGPPSTYTMWASFYGNVPLYMIKETDNSFNIKDFKISKHF